MIYLVIVDMSRLFSDNLEAKFWENGEGMSPKKISTTYNKTKH